MWQPIMLAEVGINWGPMPCTLPQDCIQGEGGNVCVEGGGERCWSGFVS